MLLPRFEYRAARSVREAMSLWAEQPGSRYLAGGTDLLPQMRTRLKGVARVIDVKRIPELAEIHAREDGGIAVGSAVSLAQVSSHPAIREHFPILVSCADEVGAWPLRNRATLAGNVCNASPAADTVAALMALEAQVVVEGAEGQRSIPVTELFVGPGKTTLAPGELVTEVVLPGSSRGFRGQYLRLSRRKGMDLATVGVLVARGGNPREPAFRISLAAVSPKPMRVIEAERHLAAEGLVKGLMRAAEIAEKTCSPITDVRGTAEYRREMVGVLVARGLKALA